MYRSIRPWLFQLPPETAHRAALRALQALTIVPGGTRLLRHQDFPILSTSAFGLQFRNPLGLAAGFDKDGRALTGLTALGFGFIEVGTVTPRPQPGNPKPRLFRLPDDRALINRLGFNNGGMDALGRRLTAHRHTIPIGVNIGKNRDTPIIRAVDDYRLAFCALAPYASYITINLSSPNTPGLRALQEPEIALELLGALKEDQDSVFRRTGRRVPLVVKIAPDLTYEALNGLISVLGEVGCDAIVATNTTIERPVSKPSCTSQEQGGLSGAPLAPLSREIISRLFKALPHIPIVGVGGIINAEEAWKHLLSGASLLQIYTGLVYEGPGLIQTILQGLAARIQQEGFDDLACALQAGRRNLSSGIGPNMIKF